MANTAFTSERSPFDWTQPVLPPLPEGEAQRVEPIEMFGAPATFPPHTAPGFQAAWRLGMLPAPPPQVAPQRLPGLSANEMLWAGVALFFGTIVLVCSLPEGLPGLVFGLLSTFGGGGAFWLLFRTGVREEAEFAAGYTSRSAYTGLWRLGRDGSVLREPDRTVPPPGFYPSPYQPGLLQRWDGPGWKPFTQYWKRRPQAYLRWPTIPFLDEYRRDE